MTEEVSYSRHFGVNDDYNIPQFARDDPRRFLELVEHLNPRDQEMLICYALLGKRPTDLSILFGKAGHRAEENLHKAAHKLAGIASYGILPDRRRIKTVLESADIRQCFANHELAMCIWQYARNRDFGEMAKLIGHPGLRQEMLRTFKKLHATKGRESGLLAGWILWLVDGANAKGAGWAKNKRSGRYKLGPTVFRTFDRVPIGKPNHSRAHLPRMNDHGGRAQRADQFKVKRQYSFLLRGMNA